MAWSDDSRDRAVLETEFDPADGPVSQRVVAAVASHYDVDPTALEPLYDTIDPDALDALLDVPARDPDRSVTVTFPYEDLAITVDSEGTIHLEPVGI